VGKTVIALTAVKELIEEKALRKVIVAAPAKVIEQMVWLNEAAKWTHLRGLRLVQLEGDSRERTRRLLTTNGETHIVLVSLNNLAWLLDQDHECDGIVIDELSKAGGKQTKGLKSKKKSGQLTWRVGMTATPVSQDFQKLYAMCRVIDGGAALGTNKNDFLRTHFFPDYSGHSWTLRGGASATIMMRVAPLVHIIDDNKAEVLPPLLETTITFPMPPRARLIYNEMRKHMVIEDEQDVEAANQAVKSGKLRQIASGFVYNAAGNAVRLDKARLFAAETWWNALGGAPGLIFYEFVEQLEQLAVAPPNVTTAQIQAMSHGVEGLQHKFADVLFYQPIWSRDAAEQAVGRVWRQGQTKIVNVTTLICDDSLDGLVIQRVEDRGQWMKLFKQHLKG
jgi:SNF2 family DNA or RNA helicase